MARRILNLDHAVKVKIAISLIALSTLVSSVQSLVNREMDELHLTDKVVEINDKFAGLKGMFPPLSVVGYVSDLHPDREIEKHYVAGHYSEHNVVEYILSPIVLEEGADFRYVIGNFHKPVDLSRIEQDNRLILVKDFHNGAIVFRSEKVR